MAAKRAYKKPTPVTIADEVVPVKMVEGVQKKKLVEKKGGMALAPNTTEQDDLVTAGQRRVNLIWEFTQAIIAISITWAIIYCSIKNMEKDVLTNAFFLIVSMYFVRTNHKLIGGVGNKPLNEQR